MADTPETPKTDTPAKPVRRRAPRTTAAKPAASKTAAAKAPAANSEPAASPAPTTKAAAAKTPKPRSTKRATPHSSATKAAPKRGKASAPATEKSGSHWGVVAAFAGSAAAIGAAIAAIFSLRGSTPKDAPAEDGAAKGAHQADGRDSSNSFKAGVADEGSIPN